MAGLSSVLEGLGSPINYFPGLARALDSSTAAILCQQICYWSSWSEQNRRKEDEEGKKPRADYPDNWYGWFWKRRIELAEELGFSLDELDTARKKLRDAGVIKEEYKRLTHTLWMRIDKKGLDTLWYQYQYRPKLAFPISGNREYLNGVEVKSNLARQKNTESNNKEQRLADSNLKCNTQMLIRYAHGIQLKTLSTASA